MTYLHVDVDNLWVYENEFGIKIHPDKEYIYSKSLPLLLRLLKKTNSKATFMIIGKDLEQKACRNFCKKAISEGHEIANHTWSHPISFAKLSRKEKEEEITKAHKQITKVCGQKPVGFRGAGYYQDKEIVSILKRLGYKYDSSVLPGFSQCLMSSYALLKGKKIKQKTFGRTSYLLSPDKKHVVKGINSKEKLIELPISVLPFVRLPMHTTFAYFFGNLYRKLIFNYLKSKPDYLLYLFHAIDFVDLPKKNKDYPVIPLRYSFEERIAFIENVLQVLVEKNGEPLKTSKEIVTSSHR